MSLRVVSTRSNDSSMSFSKFVITFLSDEFEAIGANKVTSDSAGVTALDVMVAESGTGEGKSGACDAAMTAAAAAIADEEDEDNTWLGDVDIAGGGDIEREILRRGMLFGCG